MPQKRSARRAEIRRLADRVKEAVDDGAKSAEEIHKRIAGLPLDVLERLDVMDETVADVRKVQERSIGAVYDLVRSVNREVATLAKNVLAPQSRKQPRGAAKPRKAPSKAGAKERAA